MLRRFRGSTAVHAALGLAAFLTIGASFGLHPEPGFGAGVARAADGISAAETVTASHTCLACLAHGAALASPASDLVAAARTDCPRLPLLDPSPASRLEGRSLTGRSPPAIS